jgi:hypothetical protein
MRGTRSGGGRYKLVIDGTRTAGSWPLAPKVHAEWVLRSASTNPDRRTAADLLDLGFDRPLNQYDAASADGPVNGSVVVTHQGGAAQPGIKQVTVDVTYDDGKTWHSATVTRHGAKWSIGIPAGGTAGGFATVRASATDSRGTTLSETLTRAYALR